MDITGNITEMCAAGETKLLCVLCKRDRSAVCVEQHRKSVPHSF